MAQFSFADIPAYLRRGACAELPNQTAYVDGELTDIYINNTLTPPDEYIGSWTSCAETTQICNTVGDRGVVFSVKRWTRDGSEMEYWRAENDMFFAHCEDDQFTAIYCISGHPGLETPALAWGNSDGGTDPPDLNFNTPEELIAQIYPVGVDFVKNQEH